jgi:hypothetical protein
MPCLEGSGPHPRLLWFTAVFYPGSFAFPFDLKFVRACHSITPIRRLVGDIGPRELWKYSTLSWLHFSTSVQNISTRFSRMFNYLPYCLL